MIRTEIILVGNELLSGARTDAHLAFLGRSLAEAGIAIGRCTVIGDDVERITAVLREAVERSDLLLLSGGLGPTIDDITRDAVAAAFELPLELHHDSLRALESFFERIAVPLNDATRRQASFPAGAHPIPNPVGTAAGFRLELSTCVLFVLPGPPRELQPMVLEEVVPSLKSTYSLVPLFSRTYKTAGLGESALADKLAPLYERYPQFNFSSLPARGCVDIIVTERRGSGDAAEVADAGSRLQRELVRLLGNRLFGTGDATLAGRVGELLAGRNETLSIAESLTGGMLGKRLTDIPGSSRFLLADVVAYSNEAKCAFLDVAEATLVRYGAVSEQVCAEMAEGVRRRTGAAWGIATTGIAGPGGGSEQKPVGLCYYGIAGNSGTTVTRSVFAGSRAHIRERVTNALLFMLYQSLQERG